jgi:hypothetical protein
MAKVANLERSHIGCNLELETEMVPPVIGKRDAENLERVSGLAGLNDKLTPDEPTVVQP